MISTQEQAMFAGASDRSKLVAQVFFVVLLCAGVGVLLYSMVKSRPSTGVQRVEFRVEASGGYAIITLDAGDTSIPKPTTVSVPWTKSLRIISGTEVYLTASNPTQTGKITCTITLDKKPWKSDTTTAPKDGVACAGIVP
jgi:hypothetical protein